MSELPWFSEKQVADRVALTDVIAAVTRVVERETRGSARNIAKTMTTWDPASSAHALGAIDTDDQLVAFKTWVNTPRGASAILTLFDTVTGVPLLATEAGALGALRTAAVSGLATRLMSRPDADELAVIGSGRQALRQVAAVKAVRPLKHVRVWSPHPASRETFAATVHDELQVDVRSCPSLEAAVDGASIVTLITRAAEPFLRSGLLAPGAHLNAVGAILPHSAEFDPKLLAIADLVAVDNLENARRGSRELTEFFGDDWSAVRTLGDLLTGSATRPGQPRLTVFKGMGMGLADLAAASLLLDRRPPVPAVSA